MIKNKGLKLSFSMSFIFTLFFHVVVLFFVKKNTLNYNFKFSKKRIPLTFDNIKILNQDEIAQLKKVGIKNGKKNEYLQPDMLKPKSFALSLGSLTPHFPAPRLTKIKKETRREKSTQALALDTEKLEAHSMPESIPSPLHLKAQEDNHTIYFNSKKEKIIQQNHDQDNLKQEAFNNNSSSNSSPIAQKMSNFEIRYERPEGVSEDELNSDEKAYYSFFKRSYANYLSKLYASYEKIVIERPALEKDFTNKHILLARIDYDDKGNIILIKILKSSESDNIHYFFEETLKQLNLPNPPKSFIKNNKKFSTFYQIQIN